MKNAIVLLLKEAMTTLQHLNELPSDLHLDIQVDHSKNPRFGDYASNLALILAKPCRQAPRGLAERLVEVIPQDPCIEKIDIAGAGFINFFIHSSARAQIIVEVLKKGSSFGLSQLGPNRKLCIEPVRHEGGTAFGATLSSEFSDNPVYYIQYAHARICSVLRQLNERGLHCNRAIGLQHLSLLEQEHEKALIDSICRYPEVIEAVAITCEPHLLVYFLKELATRLHSYYNAVQLLCEQELMREARLCLLEAVSQVLSNGLNLLGVSAPESI